MMEYEDERSESSGTDDDLPARQNRFLRGGHSSSNARPTNVGPGSFYRDRSEMETLVHHIKQEAYFSLLRAFKAQSDEISWERTELMRQLRHELRVSDEEHRQLLSRVNADDMIRRIRDWRAGRLQPGRHSGGQPDMNSLPIPSPISASLKRHKSSMSVAPSHKGGPSSALYPSMQPSSSAMKHGSSSAGRGNKYKPFHTTGTGRTQLSQEATYDPYVGRKVCTRWPEDNQFYEAVITEYDPLQGRHLLVYDMYTTDETWEWVNLKEIPPEDIQWEDCEPGASHKGGHPGSGRGVKAPVARGGAVRSAGRGRGNSKPVPKSNFPPVHYGIVKKAPGDIELLHTETLIRKIEKIFYASRPDPTELQKAKIVLKEHEQALVDAIAMLEDASDGESGNN